MSFLNDYVSGINSSAMAYGNMSQSNSNAGTSFNTGNYSSSGSDWLGAGSNLMSQLGSQLLKYYISR